MSEETGLCLDRLLSTKRAVVKDFIDIGSKFETTIIELFNKQYNEVLQMSNDPVLGCGFSDSTVRTAVSHALNCNSVRKCLSTVGEKGMIVKIISGHELPDSDVKYVTDTVREVLGDNAVVHFGVYVNSEMKCVKEVVVLAAVRQKY